VVITAAKVEKWPLGPNTPVTVANGVLIQQSGLDDFGMAQLQLASPTSPVTIQDNADLTKAQICAFVAALGSTAPTLDPGVTCP
jgi:hypothetical protein